MCQCLNEAARENKRTQLIPDHVILLFLSILDDMWSSASQQQMRELTFKELKWNDLIFIIQRY